MLISLKVNVKQIYPFLITVYLIVVYSVIFIGCNKAVPDLRTLDTHPVSIKKINLPAGSDTSVSAESGGNGFTGEGWNTKTDYNIISKHDSYKGGGIVLSVPEFPVTICPYGKNYNNFFNHYCSNLLYETLLQTDPVTSAYVPMLATHWKISENGKLFKFRLNPDARWADGSPVTSKDIIATWKLLADEGIMDPYTNEIMNSFEEPVAESKYIVSIKSKVEGWRQFHYISRETKVLPAQYIENIPGKEFISRYQFNYLPGSGPYLILDNEIVKRNSITLRRRSDYWAEKEKFSSGKYNFDFITFNAVRNDILEHEKFKKGEIDLIEVRKAHDWEEKYNFDNAKRGLILKRMIFNKMPKGINGICINTTTSPFNDLRIRKALIYAFDRDKINEKLFYGSYTIMNSYFPGSIYENPSNPKIGFNLDSSAMLLEEAGWKEKNSEGYLIKNGKVFEIDLPFQSGMDRFLTIYQEDLKKVGIKINLKEIDPTITIKLGSEKEFTLLPVSWIPSILPNPESNYHSRLSRSKNNSNWSGINNKEIDRLINVYNNEDLISKRVETINKIDSLLTNNAYYILFWYAPYVRIVFHNLFSFPDCIIGKESGIESVLSLWSYDPVKIRKYNEALQNESIMLDTGNVINKFWILN